MKHGDKAKAKSAKASSKSSGSKKSSSTQEAGSKAAGKKDGGAKAGSQGKGAAAEAVPKSAGKVAPASVKADAKGGRNGGPPPGSFSNALIANAFKRAVKKYPNAFRRLTD